MSDSLIEALNALPKRQRHFKDWLAEQTPERRDAILDAIYDGQMSRTKLEVLLRDFGANISSDTIGNMRRRGRPTD